MSPNVGEGDDGTHDARACVGECGCNESRAPRARSEVVKRALRLEYLTVGWNIIEGVIAVTAALTARSVALLGFGIDSFVETASGVIGAGQREDDSTDPLRSTVGSRVVNSLPGNSDALTAQDLVSAALQQAAGEWAVRRDARELGRALHEVLRQLDEDDVA